MPKGRSRRSRRELNPAIIVLAVLAVGLVVVAVGLGLIYWHTQLSPEPAPAPAARYASGTPSPARRNDDDQLAVYWKRLIGTWVVDLPRDGATRRMTIEFRTDWTQVGWGVADDGRRVEAGGRWEPVRVENGQLLVRTHVNGITKEVFYSFPTENEFRYVMTDGRLVVARRAK